MSQTALDQARRLYGEGRFAQAEALLRRTAFRGALACEADGLMGVVLARQHKASQAEFFFRRAVNAGVPESSARARINYATMLLLTGRAPEALAELDRAWTELTGLAPPPGPPAGEALTDEAGVLADAQRLGIGEYWLTRGPVCSVMGDADGALHAARVGAALLPGDSTALLNLGSGLTAAGLVEAALEAMRGAMALAAPRPPRADQISNYLMTLQYSAAASAAKLEAEHRRLGRFLGPAPEGPEADGPERTRLERLRARAGGTASRGHGLTIGYLSADLRGHSVASFAESFLRHHDRGAFRVLVYATAVEDSVSQRLRGLVDGWLNVATLSDEAVVERVERDGVDILVDLNGHTEGGRLGVLARRAAPRQATYLGYPGIVGHRAIDARIVDALTDPPGAADAADGRGAIARDEPAREAGAGWSDPLLRLPRCFLAYTPRADAPAVTGLPALGPGDGRGAGGGSGVVTFGSFNTLPKLNAVVLGVWRRVLDAVPRSRLVVKARGLSTPRVRAHWARAFAEAGMGPERVTLTGWLDRSADHLAAYGAIDIALDPWPYHGTTTTCEALWMGVPVVTRASDRHAGRVGVSLLTAAGLGELVALDDEAYVTCAARLAGDLAALARRRATLREQTAASPLTDGRALAAALEGAYRRLWEGAGLG